MGEIKLNLARKWRSKQFDEIIGQELFAKRELAGSFIDEYAAAPATDLTILTLYHRPQ